MCPSLGKDHIITELSILFHLSPFFIISRFSFYLKKTFSIQISQKEFYIATLMPLLAFLIWFLFCIHTSLFLLT